MKNLVRAVLSFGLVVALLSGCGSSVKQPGDDGGTAPPDTTADIGADVSADVPIAPECENNGDCTGRFPDAGPCKVAVCNTTTGQCALENTKNYDICDDGSECSSTSVCVDGACQAIINIVCEDENPCTNDTCDPATGCVHAPATGASCNDGDPCTGEDTCSADGVCEGGGYVCDPCVTDGDCAPFEDEDLCNGTLACVAGTCRVAADTRVVCDTSGDPACQRTRCVPATGACEFQPLADDAACEDGNLCTQGDTCTAGVCGAGTYVCPPCETATDCSDYAPDNLCLGTVGCVDGECQVDPTSVVVCDPTGDPCSVSYCDAAEGSCKTRAAVSGTPCDDGDACTTADRCREGTCAGRVNSCDDGNGCTEDRCDGDTGECSHVGIACDDHDACTTDTCDTATGDCSYEPVVCNDENACTEDSCDEATGDCVYAAKGCDDQNACTTDTCDTATGECAHVATVCDDENACTTDSCDPETGDCVNAPVVCDDGSGCTVDTCDAATGQCSFTARVCDDGNACTTDSCNETTGACVFTPVECGDGNVCNGIETCNAGTGDCQGGDALVCDDGNPCNGVESCNGQTGCFVATPAPQCDDGDPCDGTETCNPTTGGCDAGTALVCDDENPCNGVEACTTNVGCETVTPAPNCDDSVACTVDSCDPGTGDCVHDDSACVTVETDCADVVDNDNDGFTDCADDDCTNTVACGACPTDDYEDDDSFETAAPVTAGASIAGLTSEFGDEDWFAVELCAGGVLDLNVLFSHADGDIDVGLFNAEGALVAQSVSEDDNEHIGGTILQEGTYYVAVIMYTEDGCNSYELVLNFDDSTCGSEICFDEVDNDGDELVDCEDPDCADAQNCQGPVACEAVTSVNCGDQVAGSTAGLVSNLASYGCDPLAPETGGDVVYAFTPPSDGEVRLVLTPAGEAVDLDAFVLGPDCNTGACLTAGATSGGEDFSFEAMGGGTYFIAVDGFDGAEGDFTLTVECFGATTERICDDEIDNDGDEAVDCADDDCANDPACVGPQLCVPSAALACGDSVAGDTTEGAMDIAGYPCSPWDESGPEIAYVFTAEDNADVTLTLSGLAEGEDLDVFVLSDACDAAGCVTSGDTGATFAAVAGQTYYIVVDGYLGSASPFTLDLACDLATVERDCADDLDNDDDGFTDCDDEDCALAPNCTPAQDCGPVSDVVYECGDTISDSTFELSSHIDRYSCSTWDESGPDRVHWFQVAETTAVTLRLATLSGADLDLFILTDTCASDACAAYTDSAITFTAEAGVDYFLVVDGYRGAADDYTVTIECGTPTERDCADGVDNDGDGVTDCDDEDCAGSFACSVTGTCSAVDTIGCEETIQGDTTDADAVIGFYSCGAWDESGPELAYSFVALEDGPVTFALDGLAVDLDLIVLDGECDATACIAETDSRATIDAVAGTTYYVVVDGYQGAAGAFTLSATCTPATPEVCDDMIDNDEDGLVDCEDFDCVGDPACEMLCEIDGYEPNDAETEATALRAGQTQVHSLCPAGDVDWFTFTLEEAAGIVLETGGESGDTQMTLFDADLNEVEFDDDDGAGLFSYINRPDVPAGTYYVSINEYQNDDAIQAYAIRLTLQALCEADAVVTCDDEVVAGSTFERTPALDGYGCTDWSESGPEVVYGFTPDATTEVTFFLSGTTSDLDLLVLVDDCSTLNCGAAVDNEISFLAEAGRTYFIVVDGFEGAASDFELNIGCAVPVERECADGIDNDLDDAVDCDDSDCEGDPACVPPPTCTAVETLACGGSVEASTVDLESIIDAYDCATYPETGGEYAVEFTAETSGRATVTLAGLDEGQDLDVFVLAGECAASQCVAFGGTAGGENFEFQAEAGVTYYIVVDGYQGAASPFTLSLACGDAREVICDDQLDGDNDGFTDCDDPDCAAAPNCNVVDCVETASLVCGQVVESTTVDGADDMVYYSCSNWREDGPEVVYSFTSETTEIVSFELTGMDVDLDLFVLPDACNNTNCGAAGDRRLTFQAEAGVTYYVVVDGYQGVEGAFTLTTSCLAEEVERSCDDGVDNDLDELTDCDDPDCVDDPACAPQTCDPAGTLACGDVLDGTTLGEFANLTDYSCLLFPETGPELVWAFTVDFDREVTLDLGILGLDPTPDLDLLVLADACDASACVAASASTSATETVTWNALAGTTYYVVVDGFGGAAGDFMLTATCAEDVVELECADDIDNDGDGATDCDDSDCVGAENCAPACVDDGFEDNDTQAGAVTLPAGEAIDGQVCTLDEDWFAVDVPAGCQVTGTLLFTHLDGDLEMRLFDPSETAILSSTTSTDNESITYVSADGGLYAFRIWGYSGAENVYGFSVAVDCAERLCADQIDNDDNGFTDCDDANCVDDPACATCADAYEPDGEMGTATDLVVGEAQTHSLCPLADHDWFAFVVVDPSDAVISTSGPSGDAYMKLYDEAGAQITSDDDNGPGLFPEIRRTLEPGLYYAEMYEFGDNALIEEYTITLELGPAGVCPDDAFEPDSQAAPTALAAGEVQARAICPVGDVDWYTFTLAGTATVTIDTAGPAGDAYMYLYDAGGAVIETDDDDGAGLYPMITRELAAGTYLVSVNEYGDNAEIPAYTITLTVAGGAEICDNQADDDGDELIDCADPDCAAAPGCAVEICDNMVDDDGDQLIDCADPDCAGRPPCPCAADAFEPNDEGATATPIVMEETLAASICPTGDADWFVFSLEGPQAVTLETAGAAGDTELTLFDVAGNEVGYNDDIDFASGNRFSRVTVALDAGTYYAVVNEWGDNANIHAYTMSLYGCSVDAYEDDDTEATATALVAGDAPQGHSICPAGDVDWYTFTTDAMADVRIMTMGSPIEGPAGDTVMVLYDEGGAEIAFNDDPTPGNLFAAIEVWDLPAGTYQVAVLGLLETVAVPNYEIALETTVLACPGDDRFEDNDTLGTAALLGPGAAVRGIRCADDDWFSLSVEAGCRVDADLLFAHADGDLDLALVNAQNGLVQGSTSTTDNEHVSAIISVAGTYYLRVYYGQNRYALGYTLTCPLPEVCDDGVDNDLDSATDCADSDCDGNPACQETLCDDAVDNDSDGFTDCDDTDCDAAPNCVDDAFEDNDSFDTAVDGPAGGAGGLVSVYGDDDWFVYEVCASGTITVDLFFVHSVGDIDLFLRDATDSFLASSGSSTDDESASWTNDTGAVALVYVRMHNYTFDTVAPYEMVVTIECAEICDNMMDDDGDGAIDCADEDCAGDAACPPLPPVSFAQIQWPVEPILVPADGALPEIFGRVYVEGTTPGEGKGFGVRGQLGFGPDGSDPAVGLGWTWIEGAYNGELGNDDEFVALPTGIGVGLWDYAWRFTTDNGAIWVYADLPPGTDDGYDPLTTGSIQIQGAEICDNLVDDDGDQAVDCDDSDCAATPVCAPACVNDGYEPNETFAEATPYQGFVFASVMTDGEFDWYSVVVCAGATVTFTAEFNAATDIDIHGFNGAQVGIGSSTGFGGVESFSYTSETAQTLYLRVREYSVDTCASYDLTITVDDAACTAPAAEAVCDDGVDNDYDGAADCEDSDCAADAACAPACVDDAHEPNDTFDAATPYEGFVFASVMADGDFDWYSVLVCAGATVTFTAEFDAATDIDIHGYDGAQVGIGSSTGFGGVESFSYTSETAQTLYLRVREYSTDTCASYDLTITVDDAACATPVAEPVCDDGIDNDYDGLADCEDSDCAGVGNCPAGDPNPFFWIYLEGSSNNKALEIVNFTNAGPLDLSTCQVRLSFNGGTSTGSIQLDAGTLRAGEVFVLCNTSIALGDPNAYCDQRSGGLTYNGDDAVYLVCGDTTYDVIGQIGVDPGSAWTAGGVTTQNQTLVRFGVTSGDPDGTDPFDPSVEWLPLGNDNISGFGVWPFPAP